MMQPALLFVSILLGASSPQDPPVVVSSGVQAAMQRQAARADDTSLDALAADLRALIDKDDPTAAFLFVAMTMSEKSDRTLRRRLLLKSASDGCAGAATMLAMDLLESDDPSALMWAKSAAESGDASAQALLAGLYRTGKHGIDRDLVEAFAWTKLAERQAYAKAMLPPLQIAALSIEQALPPEDKAKAEARAASLAASIKVAPYYLCGQAAPGRDR